jgi:DNA mismatch repair protein MutL
MSTIHLLDQDLINKIAAGEVVERPSSVVKELVENALDAEGTQLEVKILQGGIDRIIVQDNGKGMTQEDAKMCLLRHATSKLQSADDLFALRSMGFRGEALASIASVSQFSLITKTKEESNGYRVWLDEQQKIQAESAPANTGTRVTVDNLFYNVPARQKFLKTASTEFSHILRYLQQVSLIHPSLEIVCTHNDKEIFHYLPESLQERVQRVMGKQWEGKMIPLQLKKEGISLEGFVSIPSHVHSTHKYQYLFVNGRPIYDHLLSRTVLNAYETMVPKGYFPSFVLKLDIDPSQVDVNVHPRKSEVKFLQMSAVMGLVKSAVRQSLQDHDLVPKQSLYQPSEGQEASYQGAPSFSSWKSAEKKNSAPSPYRASSPQKSIVHFPAKSTPSHQESQEAMKFSQEFMSGRLASKEYKKSHPFRIIGQLHLSCILLESSEGLLMGDQHAISEIVNYQQIKKNYQQKNISSQSLLLPEVVSLQADEMELWRESLEFIQDFGWEVSEIGSSEIQISALPEVLKKENVAGEFQELLLELQKEKTFDHSKKEEELIKYQACRSAVMVGDQLTQEEMEQLVSQWYQVENNAACEHGRPALAEVTLDEIRSFFNRGKVKHLNIG